MELEEHVVSLQQQLSSAAATGSAETQAIAEQLIAGLDAPIRLALLDVLSAAAAEVTRELAPGSVDVRLRGREVQFVVEHPSLSNDAEPLDSRANASSIAELEGGSASRTTLRLPDALKSRIDEAATSEGISVNSWLVRAAAAALHPKQRRTAQRALRTGGSFVGWAR